MTPTSKPSIVALIPARAGSKRIKDKAIKPLGGKPLIRWTVDAAVESGIFEQVIVCADSREILQAAGVYDCGVHAWLRPPVSDTQADIDWVRTIMSPSGMWSDVDAFAILRPTSPFRSAQTIQIAWRMFTSTPCDSLRAVRLATENPYKMWQPDGRGAIDPLLDQRASDGTPWHSLASQTTMGTLYVQTAGMEMAWTRVLRATPPTISGERVIPFHLEGIEAIDINTPEDWTEAEYHMAERHHPIEYLG